MGYYKIVAREFGGPEVLKVEQNDELPEPGPDEVRLRVEAAGVGYTDTIVRRGRYPAYTGGLPVTPGYDVVGIIDKLGANVTDLCIGDRVADMTVSGAYSQYIIRPAGNVIPVPDTVDAFTAVEVPLMWVTAFQMLTRIVPLAPEAPILVVGASGAVGRAMVMLGRHLNLKVIGTCSASNMKLVESIGAIAVDYRRTDLVEAIHSISGGTGVLAAFDAIGGASWKQSWEALAPKGILVGYGLQDFVETGVDRREAETSYQNLHKIWPEEGRTDGTNRTCQFYDIRERRQTYPDEYRSDAITLFELIASGGLVPPCAEVLPLNQAAEAHRRIAAGGLKHRLVLQP